MGVIALVAVTGISAAAFQIDPDILTEVSTPATGLWVPAPLSGEIVHIDVASADVTARVKVAAPGADLEIEERGDSVVVVDRESGAVSLIDPALNVVSRDVRTAPIGEGPVDIGRGAIAVGSGTDVTIVDLDVTDTATRSMPGVVRSLAADGAGVLAEDGAQRIGLDAAGTMSGPDPSDGMLVRSGDDVLVVRPDGVDALDGTRRGCFETTVGQVDHAVGSADSMIVVVEGAMVHISDLANGTCVSVSLGDDVVDVGRPVVADRHVFVPGRASGVVHVIEPSRGVVEHFAVMTAGGDIRVRARAGFVVAYDAAGRFAALLKSDGEFRPVTTDFQLVAGDGDGDAIVPVGDDLTGGSGDGSDPVSAAPDAPIIDPSVLALTLRNQEELVEEVPADDLVANFAFSASTVAVGESVRFVDTSSGSPESWIWDFGDGTGDEGPEVEKAWDEPGTYPVNLKVSRGDVKAEISLAITVVPREAVLPPAADFALSSSVVAVGRAVEFEDRSAGEIDRWRWDFGDGTTASTPDATKTWDTVGTYTVQLTVANDLGSDFATVEVEVVDRLRKPEAVITVAETEVDLGAALTFKGSSATDPASYRWDFGDGKSSTGPQVVHVFLQEGTFEVRLTAENSAGSSSTTVKIEVSPPTLPPTAAIASLPAIIEAGDDVTLSSISTNQPDEETWSFGDGESAAGRRVTHTWEEPGSYLLSLTASNVAGTDSITKTIQVVAELPAPVARIGEYDASPWVGQPTLFLDTSVDATGWLWDFGDGGTSNAPNPLHTFNTPGRKVVTLTVSNRNGTDTATVIVEPRLQPAAAFSVASTAARVGQGVKFTDASVNATKWLWNFGDGTSSAARSPVHTFTAAGPYVVTLTVENSVGDADTSVPITITVDPAAPLLSTILKLPTDVGAITTLATTTFEAQTATASGPIDRYEIDFGDGSVVGTGTSARFSHVFEAKGSYVVRMRAHGPLGEWSAWVSRTFTVADPPVPVVAIADSLPATALIGNPVALPGQALATSGPVTTWRWEITKGGVVTANYTGQNATHSFAEAGVYTIKLTGIGPVASASVTRNITINIPPPPTVTSLTASNSPATVGRQVGFTPIVSGSVAKWEWNYEGTGYVEGGPTGQKIYNTAGTYQVTVRVTDLYNGVATRSIMLTVNPRPAPTIPVATPSGQVQTGTTVSFTSTDANAQAGLAWTWTFTKNAESYTKTGQTVSHTFASAGSWTVTVTATDANGATGSSTLPVAVVDPAPLVASFSSASGPPGQVQFTDTSGPYAIDSWTWDFGSSSVGGSTVANPLVTYPGPGTYVVTLTVTAGGRTDDFQKSVTVP